MQKITKDMIITDVLKIDTELAPFFFAIGKDRFPKAGVPANASNPMPKNSLLEIIFILFT